MALVAKRSKRTTVLIVSLLVVILGGVGYLVVPKLFSNPSQDTITTDVNVRDLKIVDRFDDAVVTDPRFQALRSYGDPLGDVDLNTVGRTNPFSPLQ